jgi:integrase
MEDRSHYLKRSGKFISKRTIDNDVMNISTVYKWALKRELVSKNPADYSRDGAITLYDAPETPRPVFTSEEYQALLAEAKGEGNTLIYDIVVVLANTGMRYGELASLTTDALNWSGNSGSSITIRATDDFSPKDKHEVKTIPMRLEVEEVLRRRSQDLKKGERLFRNSLGNTINPNNTRKSFYRLIRQIGIERKERPLDWHAWRRFFVRNAVQSGIPINIIMSWTGHDSISMVMHYSKTIERQDSMSAIQRIKTA